MWVTLKNSRSTFQSLMLRFLQCIPEVFSLSEVEFVGRRSSSNRNNIPTPHLSAYHTNLSSSYSSHHTCTSPSHCFTLSFPPWPASRHLPATVMTKSCASPADQYAVVIKMSWIGTQIYTPRKMF